MTIEQFNDNRAKYRTLWVKRGENIVKKESMDVSQIRPINTIVAMAKEPK